MTSPAKTPAARLTFRLHARPSSAIQLRRRLRAWLEHQGVAEPEIFDILLAASEAFANAVEHPRTPAASVVDVEARIEDGMLEVAVRDHGSWRDKREREEGGLGFPIMRSLMERVDVDSQADGSRITLRRLLRSSVG